MLHEARFGLSVVLSETVRRAAQSKDLSSGARFIDAKRGPSTSLRSAQDDGLSAAGGGA